jgi:hypothetical protein
MMTLLTLIFPPEITGRFNDTAGNTVSPDATGRCVVDSNVVVLSDFFDAGFSMAADVASATRPSTTYPGQLYFDTTLNAGAGLPIFRNTANNAWINAAGVVV